MSSYEDMRDFAARERDPEYVPPRLSWTADEMASWDEDDREAASAAMDRESPKCLDSHKGGCSGSVEYRASLSGTGTPIARCDKHYADRLEWQKEHNRKYPDSPCAPAWFNEADAGERWDDDY